MGRGRRVADRRKRSFNPAALVLTFGITLCVIAWGYLVYAAIDFGTTARGGQSSAWWFLGLASLGAVACLFAGLLMVTRLLRSLGIIEAPERSHRPPGGRRASR